MVRYYGGNVLGRSGFPAGQEYFSYKLFGGLVVQGATVEQLAFALSDTYARADGAGTIQLSAVHERGRPTSASNNAARRNLQNGKPFIVLIVPLGSSTGHYLTIYGMDWSENADGDIVGVKGLHAADPFEGLYHLTPGIAPAPAYLDTSVYSRFTFEGAVWVS